MKFNPYAKIAEKVKVFDKKTNEPFNPYDFGRTATGAISRSAKSKVFTDSGELNASSKKDALEKIRGLLDGQSSGEFQVEARANTLKTAGGDSDAIIRQAMSDPNSPEFAKAGQQLLMPIKEVIDYETITRKLWVPRSVKQGVVVRYDKDVYVTGWSIAEDGQTPISQVEGAYVYPADLQVTAYPSIELKDVYRAQYDILARAQERARQEIEHQEDLAAVNLLRAGGATENPLTLFPTLNIGAFESLRYQIERHRLICSAFLIHRREMSDIVNTVRSQVDPVTQRELVMAGFIGSILNAMIVTTAGTNNQFQVLDPGEVIAVTLPEYLGGLAVRVDLMSEPVTRMHEGIPQRGWFWYEMFALCLINSKGVALGQKTT